MATRKVRSQWFYGMFYFLEGLLILGLSIFGIVQIFLSKTVTKAPAARNTVKAWLSYGLHSLEKSGHPTLVKGVLVVIFIIVVVKGLALLVEYAPQIRLKGTPLGKSILNQASPHEKLGDILKEIDTDMARESQEIGGVVRIGSQWVLGDEAMKLSKVQKMSRGKVDKEHALMLEDDQNNKIGIAFTNEHFLDEAVRFIQRRVPEAEVKYLSENA